MDAEDWLVSEVKDLLEAGSVGLYEFMWLLNSGRPEVDQQDRQGIAEAALKKLLLTGAGSLALLRWPDEDSTDTIEPNALRDSDWDIPPDKNTRTYIALTQN